MTNDKEKKPLIRFKGFTDTWEQRELWQLTIWDKKFNEVEKAKQPQIIKYPYVLADVFNKIEDNSGNVFLLSTGSYMGYTTEEKAGNNLCNGEVIAIPWGGVPNIKYFKGKFVTADNRIATSNDKNVLSNKYLYYWFWNKIKQVENIYRGASIKHPSMNDILNMKISYPQIDEQQKINNILTKVENLITLYQRKHDKFVNIKKSMLEKMFPQGSANVPKVRFKGFTDTWEQRELGELGKCQSGIGFPDSEQGGKFGIPFYKVSDMNNDGNEYEMNNANNYVTEGQIIKKGWKPIDKVPVVIFAKVGAAIMLNRKRLCRKSFLIDNNTMAYKFDKTWEIEFGRTLFERIDLTALVQVGALPSYNATDVEGMKITRPRLQEEQECIGNLFHQLNNLITLHRRECEKLKNIKKACLEKMFI